MTATVSPAEARTIAEVVRAVPGISDLADAGAGAATFLAGERVRGVRIDGDRAAVHVVAGPGTSSLSELAQAVRDAVRRRLTAIQVVDVHIDDLVDGTSEPDDGSVALGDRPRAVAADGVDPRDPSPAPAPPPPPSGARTPGAAPAGLDRAAAGAPTPRTSGSAQAPVDRRSHEGHAARWSAPSGGRDADDRVLDAAATVADAAKAVAEAAATVARTAPQATTTGAGPPELGHDGDALGDEPVGTGELAAPSSPAPDRGGRSS